MVIQHLAPRAAAFSPRFEGKISWLQVGKDHCRFFRLGQLKLLFVRARLSNEYSSATDRCRLRHDRPSRFPATRIGPIARPGKKGRAVSAKSAISQAAGDDSRRFSHISESTTELKLNNRRAGYLKSLDAGSAPPITVRRGILHRSNTAGTIAQGHVTRTLVEACAAVCKAPMQGTDRLPTGRILSIQK